MKQCESGKGLGRRISELEFVKMLNLCKASTKQTGLSANTEVLQNKEYKRKAKGGGDILCVIHFSASCDTLSAAL